MLHGISRGAAPLLPRFSIYQLLRRINKPPSFIFKPIPNAISLTCFSLNTSSHLNTHTQTLRPTSSSMPPSNTVSATSTKKARRELPEARLRHKLNLCSRDSNLVEALKLYDEARQNGVHLDNHHYNALLYLCSLEHPRDGDGDAFNLGLKRGFEIFHQMLIEKVTPNEATFTSLARLAVANEDPEMAFELVKQMKSVGMQPRLRSYGPALFGFWKKGDAHKAFQVDAHMAASGVVPEEPELSALLKLSKDAKKADKVYEMLHRLRAMVRQVSESTLEIIEDWFSSEHAAEIGEEHWDVKKVRKGVIQGGGGWHGQGWLGSGRWKVVRTRVDETGLCKSCGEKLVCIDIDPKETENFAASLTRLACQREFKADFNQFQEWLKQHGPFDAVVDGANVGLINPHNFSFSLLNFVVNQLRQMSTSKRLPLIILHKSRVTGGPALHSNNKKLLERWKKHGALYASPAGSNDDWYWLYAAVSCKCLLVTNDEMRDHLFQLLGTSFFPRWKEKHQVRLLISRHGPKLLLPPPYSILIQESPTGSWHVPTVGRDDLGSERCWLCATRPGGTL